MAGVSRSSSPSRSFRWPTRYSGKRISHRLIPAAIALGAFTFTATACRVRPPSECDPDGVFRPTLSQRQF
jgi:hypothetical protein